ncbi:hypothetical protein IUJ34_06645 [Klebsiella pneumoniae subsp. pneumoniae]|uniref:Uncharacterized protein n=1 Tax=Klebsiella pneumoniae subsp. pneumoniae TaxID=72407 RepID=A0A7S9E157_KLEPN|nr:hypothetical protein IUJ34_06645 [Klebsiella pneumoniae subsp. pneumoniae]
MSIHSSENFSDARGPGAPCMVRPAAGNRAGFRSVLSSPVAERAGLPGAAEQLSGDFYDFLREGLWGYIPGEEVPRDNSIFLLAGIISVLIVAFGVLIYSLAAGCVAQRQKRDEGSPSTACVSSTRCC